MKRALILLGLLFISCENIEKDGPIQDWQVEPIELTADQIVFSNEMLQIINEHRMSIGLNTLIKEPGLPTYLAVYHCNYMIDRGVISHDGFADRARILKDWGAVAVAENVGFGYDSPEEVVNAWLESPEHRDVIDGNYTVAGIGIREDSFGTNWITLILLR